MSGEGNLYPPDPGLTCYEHHHHYEMHVRWNDRFTSVDLKDGYFHILIHPPHRKYLQFAFRGVCCEYRVIPFGLSLSPRVYVRCTEVAIASLRCQGTLLATYLGDWLLLAQSRQEAEAHTCILLHYLRDLGFVVTWDYCSW